MSDAPAPPGRLPSPRCSGQGQIRSVPTTTSNHSESYASADVASLFAERGLRCTRQRVEIFTALAGSKTHPTAEELHRIVNDKAPRDAAWCDAPDGASEDGPCVSLATIYNALEALSRVGLVRRLPSASVSSAGGIGGGARYEADLHEHLHLTTPDGGVHDLPDDLGRRLLDRIGPDLVQEVEARMGVRIGRVNIELFGAESPSSGPGAKG